MYKRHLFGVILSALLITTAAFAQETTRPEANPADVATVDAIIKATYGAISGPADEPRDWDRFISLFAPGARLIPVSPQKDGTVVLNMMSPEDYAERATEWFSKNSFYEVEIYRTEEAYGHILHAFSTYESRRDPDEDPFARGINSFQLMHDGNRWWVVTIFWDAERPDQPIPATYLPKQ